MGINLITITLNIIQMDEPKVKKVLTFHAESNLAKTYEQSMATTYLGKVNQMQ